MHIDQNLIFIIVLAVIGISRLVARIAENAREQSQRRERQTRRAVSQTKEKPQVPAVRTSAQTDEERVRVFLEALGVPKTGAPPAPVLPRTDIPPRPLAPVSPPREMMPFPPLVKKVFTPRPTKPPLVPPAPAPVLSEAESPGAWLRDEEKIETAAAKFESATQASPNERERSAPIVNWRDALRGRESVRAAFILREILGPPRALQES